MAREHVACDTVRLARHCKSGTFDAVKIPTANNIEHWFIAANSIEKGIADLKALAEQRHDATRRDMSEPVAPISNAQNLDDMSGHDATRPDTSNHVPADQAPPTYHDTSRHDASLSDLAIYEHPYVKRLELQNEKLEARLDAQVRRTEEVQLTAQKQLIELQRMTTIGQSKTLAEFMLQARDFILGEGKEPSKTISDTDPTSTVQS